MYAVTYYIASCILIWTGTFSGRVRSSSSVPTSTTRQRGEASEHVSQRQCCTCSTSTLAPCWPLTWTLPWRGELDLNRCSGRRRSCLGGECYTMYVLAGAGRVSGGGGHVTQCLLYMFWPAQVVSGGGGCYTMSSLYVLAGAGRVSGGGGMWYTMSSLYVLAGAGRVSGGGGLLHNVFSICSVGTGHVSGGDVTQCLLYYVLAGAGRVSGGGGNVTQCLLYVLAGAGRVSGGGGGMLHNVFSMMMFWPAQVVSRGGGDVTVSSLYVLCRRRSCLGGDVTQCLLYMFWPAQVVSRGGMLHNVFSYVLAGAGRVSGGMLHNVFSVCFERQCLVFHDDALHHDIVMYMMSLPDDHVLWNHVTITTSGVL